MLNRPEGLALLEMAHNEERRVRAPGFAGNGRYISLLIARARDIAQREAVQSEAILHRELSLFKVLYGDEVGPGEDLQQALYALNVRFATDLRARRLSPAQQPQIDDLLEAQVRGRLIITNPKYLDTADPHD